MAFDNQIWYEPGAEFATDLLLMLGWHTHPVAGSLALFTQKPRAGETEWLSKVWQQK